MVVAVVVVTQAVVVVSARDMTKTMTRHDDVPDLLSYPWNTVHSGCGSCRSMVTR